MRLTRHLSTMKARMTIVVCALVFCSGVAVAMYATDIAENEMAQLVGDREFALLSGAALQLEGDLTAKSTALRIAADGMDTAAVPAPAAVQSYLEHQHTLRRQFFNLVAFSAEGMLIASVNGSSQIGKLSIADRAYYQRTLRTRQGVVSQPLRSALSGRPIVLLTQPVYDRDGRLLCILVGAIDLEEAGFFSRLDQMRPGRNGYLFALANDGTILHHPDRRRILRNVHEEPGGVVPSTERALAGHEGWSQARTKTGENALIGYKQVRPTGWIVGVVYPTREAFAPLAALSQRTLLRTGIAAACAGVLGLFAIYLLLRPLDLLRRQVARVRKGDADIDIFDLTRRDEVGALSRAIHAFTRQRAEAEAELARLVRTDALTGLFNRRMVEDELDHALARSGRTHQRVGVAFLDIDRFKQINDRHGHGAGDRVLVEFASRLKHAVRATDTAARYAGDEFVVIFEGLASEDELQALGAKIVDMMRAPIVVDGTPLAVTASVGLAMAGPGATKASVLKQADEALYSVKSAGRDGFGMAGAGR